MFVHRCLASKIQGWTNTSADRLLRSLEGSSVWSRRLLVTMASLDWVSINYDCAERLWKWSVRDSVVSTDLPWLRELTRIPDLSARDANGLLQSCHVSLYDSVEVLEKRAEVAKIARATSHNVEPLFMQ